MELFFSQLTYQNRTEHRILLMNFSSLFTLQTNHCVQLKPYRCMKIVQTLSELGNLSLPFSCHGLGNMNQSTAVPLLDGCKHASRRLVSTQILKGTFSPGGCFFINCLVRCDNLRYSQCSRLVKLNHFSTVYHWEMKDRSTFGSTVLLSADASNSHVDMETEPSKMLFMNGSGDAVPDYYL